MLMYVFVEKKKEKGLNITTHIFFGNAILKKSNNLRVRNAIVKVVSIWFRIMLNDYHKKIQNEYFRSCKL